MKATTLIQGRKCKCGHVKYDSIHGIFWFNRYNQTLYVTDPHKPGNPEKAIGAFIIDGKTVVQE